MINQDNATDINPGDILDPDATYNSPPVNLTRPAARLQITEFTREIRRLSNEQRGPVEYREMLLAAASHIERLEKRLRDLER